MMKLSRYLILSLTILMMVACSGKKETNPAEGSWTGKIHYEKISAADTSLHDVTLVFVHGLGCDMGTWREQILAFSDYDQLLIDLPGFGQSEKPEMEYTLDTLADAVYQTLVDCGCKQVVLVGHSLGTAVCRQVVMNHPEMVRGLVDVDGVYCLYPKDTLSDDYKTYCEAVNAFAAGFDTDSVSGVFEGFVSALAGPETPQEVNDYAMSTMPKTPRHVAASTMRNLIRKEYWTGAVIDVPTLVICTQNSGLMPDNRQQMEALYSHLQYEELTTCGHFIHMERAQWFNATLRSFLEKE